MINSFDKSVLNLCMGAVCMIPRRNNDKKNIYVKSVLIPCEKWWKKPTLQQQPLHHAPFSCHPWAQQQTQDPWRGSCKGTGGWWCVVWVSCVFHANFSFYWWCVTDITRDLQKDISINYALPKKLHSLCNTRRCEGAEEIDPPTSRQGMVPYSPSYFQLS